MAIVNSNI